MESRGAYPRKKQKFVSKTPENCEKEDEVPEPTTNPKNILPDLAMALLSGNLREAQKLSNDAVLAGLLRADHINHSNQQGQQRFQNVSSKPAPGSKSLKSQQGTNYADIRRNRDEPRKDYKVCGSLESEQKGTTSSDFNNYENEEYSSDVGDEIKILSVCQLDYREPCQDHVAEKILYCEPCIYTKDTRKLKLIPESKCMCFTCELYMCSECAPEHIDHLTLCVDEHDNEKDHRVKEMVNKLLLEDDDERQHQMAENRYNSCGRIDIRTSAESPACISPGSVCISKDGDLVVVTVPSKDSIRVFNAYNHEMVLYIRSSCSPYGVTEIPQDLIQKQLADYIDEANLESKSSHIYIAVSFPGENRILIIDFSNNQARIVYTIRLSAASECKEIFLCNGRLVTYCSDYDPTNHKIKLLTVKGLELCTIDILNLPDLGFTATIYPFNIAVHEESETIYICSPHDECIAAVDMTGNVTEAITTNTIDASPGRIHVDSESNLFVSVYSSEKYPSGIYKVTDHLGWWQFSFPSTYFYGLLNSYVYTSMKGKLYCKDSYAPSYFVTVLQNEPSWLDILSRFFY